MNGFLVGVIVGAALVFLFATKKGRKIVKTLTEEGLEGVSGLQDLFEGDLDDMDEMELAEAEPQEPVEVQEKPSPRRFFRGTKR